MGHSTTKMTQRYAHLRDDMLNEAIKKIDTQFNPLVYNNEFVNSTDLAQSSIDDKLKFNAFVSD